ncbi:tetratricopeptide repeat protein [Aureibacter tunicatorum]|uniref:Tetratricopeptide (TPR) repeat protein n=1 Tax=Aureibacter tunicatorum TaxID=866807 RepID=A0AAE3XPX9_9BACT|nr:tetratricopeptide repeat protein [Aureibacter tunicatorum]MDR6239791.1 tetratricopeptide (TPR) repeat protein [Aureibacter tunicatorum]BDD04266.1 hypothetical protein AUTU_17490 [Aureibacter tunicatorum]
MKRVFASLILAAVVSANAFAQKPVKGSVTKAESYLNKMELNEAKQQIDAAFANDPKGKVNKNPKAWYIKGQIYSSIAQDTTALSVDEAALKTAVESFDHVKEMESAKLYAVQADQQLANLQGFFWNKATEDYNEDDFEGAVENFDFVKVINPADTNAYLYGGVAAQQLGDDKAAVESYEGYLNHGGAKLDVWNTIVFIEKKNENYEKALEVATKAREAFPHNKDLIQQELSLLIELNRIGDAETSIKKSIENDPNNAVLYYDLGYIYEAQKKWDDAIDAYKKAVEIDPENYDATYAIGAAYYNQAVPVWNEAANMDLKTYQQKGAEVEEKALKLFNAGVPYFEKALTLKPDDQGVLEILLGIYQKDNKTAKVEEITKKLDSLQK